MKVKKGMSLIVLIITVIIIIILASVVILTISKNNPITSAKEATFKEDIRSFQSELSIYVGNEIIKDYSGIREKLTTSEKIDIDEMRKYISSFTKKYQKKLGIEKDELVYYPKEVNNQEEKWLIDLGIKKAGYTILEADEDIFLWDTKGTSITGINSQEKFEEYLLSNNNILRIPDKCIQILEISAFRNQSLIKHVIMSDNVNYIEMGCFGGCSNLESIQLSYNLKEIKSTTFSGCTALKEIVIPENIEIIGPSAFSGCTSLQKIIIPKNVKVIGESAFYNCRSLEKVEILGDLEKIETKCFAECRSLFHINLPDTVTNIGKEAFYRSGLTYMKIPDKIETIYTETFAHCSNLQKVELPSNLKNIESNAFFYCDKLEEINIPNGVTTIGFGAFSQCNSLTEIYIPATVINIDRESQTINTSALKNIIVAEDNSMYSSIDGVLFNKDKSKLISFPRAKEVEEYIIPDSVKNIAGNAFWQCDKVKTVIIPENVLNIEEKAFHICFLLIIKCKVESKPDTWPDDWCSGVKEVIWSYKDE